jgi:hypothetical protein
VSPIAPKIKIFGADKDNAITCLKIIGGLVTKYNPRNKFGFRCWINGHEWWLDKDSIKQLKAMLITTYNFSNRQFHNCFEDALEIERDSTIL